MNTIDSKNIPELRKGFKQYLAENHSDLSKPEIIVSDAFYINSHDVGITFEDALKGLYVFGALVTRPKEIVVIKSNI